jgi:hypothetical protein
MHAQSPMSHAAPWRARSFVLPAALALFNCGTSACFDLGAHEDRMTGAEVDEVAAALGALFADQEHGQARAFGGAILVGQGRTPGEFRMSGEVASAVAGGVDYSLAAVCSDEVGRGARCGDEAAMAHLEAQWSGAWAAAGFTASASFDADWVLEALDEAIVALAGHARGSATIAVARTDAGYGQPVARTWRLGFRASYSDVGLDAKTRRAVSGAVRYELEVERLPKGHAADRARVFAVRCELSWQADGGATLAFEDGPVYRAALDGSVTRLD